MKNKTIMVKGMNVKVGDIVEYTLIDCVVYRARVTNIDRRSKVSIYVVDEGMGNWIRPEQVKGIVQNNKYHSPKLGFVKHIWPYTFAKGM